MTVEGPQAPQDACALTEGPEDGARAREAALRADPRIPRLLEALPALVEAECQRRRISQRQACKELGISASTVTRLIQGRACDARTLLAIMKWLDLASDWLTEPDETHDAYRRGWADCAAHIEAALAATHDRSGR